MLGLNSLLKKGMVNFFENEDQNGNPFTVYSATQEGLAWLEQNQERLLLKKDEDVPF
jgi:DNA-binding PadR family transcriptional regulator